VRNVDLLLCVPVLRIQADKQTRPLATNALKVRGGASATTATALVAKNRGCVDVGNRGPLILWRMEDDPCTWKATLDLSKLKRVRRGNKRIIAELLKPPLGHPKA